MLPKFIIFSLLLISVISIFDNGRQFRNFTIINAKGELKEYSKDQMLTLFFSSYIFINPKDLTKIEILNDEKSFILSTICIQSKINFVSTKINCILDLEEVPSGIYKIDIFYYKNNKKYSNITIEILENEKDKKFSDIKLINVSSDIREYHDSYKNIEFSFDRSIETSLLKKLKFSDKNNKISTIELKRCKKIDNKIECFPALYVRTGKYKIINLLYDDKLIKTKGNIYFTVKEDILGLKEVHEYSSSNGIRNEKFNVLNLYFEYIAYTKFFSAFLFKNAKTNKIYNVDFKFLFNGGGSVSEAIIFDFSKLPPDDYYISFIYKKNIQNTNVKIRIKQFKKIKECELYPD